MTDERWQTIIGQVKDNFEVIKHETQDLPETEGPGTVEYIEFKGPLGLMKLERSSRPLVLGKVTHGSKRIGSETTVQYNYSDTEKTHKFRAFKFDEVDAVWVEIEKEKEKGGLFF